MVLRPRLIERLNAGLHGKVTLISAPAGFGKTTLVSEWVASSRKLPARSAAWLSLDEGDSDPTRFLTYLVAALQTLVPGETEKSGSKLGEGVLAMLQSPQPPPIESILTALLNEIAAILDEFILVLDDYHLIDAQPIDEALAFLIQHLPPQMHLVIITREDPPLPLARLRARGQLTELRATDLRFTLSEAAEFLTQVMGLNLQAEDISALELRTEGWIAGLQMAALSMQGRADVANFVQAFTGSHRFVLDYLVEEVLHQQPEQVSTFLLKTAILDRLSAPLCDAVTGRLGESKEMLAALERDNLFVVPLDDQRQWYRYHHLFADVLQARLHEAYPDEAAVLHRRASAWYAQHGLPSDAIRHALAAGDFEGAAGLIELAWPTMDGLFQSATWLEWARALPDELVRTRPVLCVGYAWALLNGGELEAAETHLQEAEWRLDGVANADEGKRTPAVEMIVVDEEQFRTLPASMATARAYIALSVGDMPGAVQHAQRALDLLPETDYIRRGPAASLLGLAQWANGDLEAAHRSLAEAMTGFRLAGNLHFALSGTYGLADIRIAQGRLQAAFNTYERSLQLARDQGESLIRGTADLYLGLSELYRERGDPEAAAQHLRQSEELGEQAALQDWPYRLRRAQARRAVDRGDLDRAIELLDEAELLYYRTPVPNARPLAALKVRVWIVQGRLDEAFTWAQERGLSSDDDLSYLREFEHITLARTLIAHYRRDRIERSIDEAMGLLERLLHAAEEGERMGSVIEILLLQALAFQAQGEVTAAFTPLAHALTLAKPEGYIRIFVDEGPPMATLLRAAAKDGIAPDYVSRLQMALEGLDSQTSGNQRLIEPLSERELDVLRLLATELSGPEIARELIVSLNTMRTHTKNIYSKLGVNNRRSAVRRAKEIGLL